MTFAEALHQSLIEYNKTTKEDIRVGIRTGKPEIWWKGLKHYTNIGNEKIWEGYEDKIGMHEGEFVIGPALYNVHEGKEVKHLDDCVGLYHAK